MSRKDKRVWLSWADHPGFSKNDYPFTHVIPAAGGRPIILDQGVYVEADDDIELRKNMHQAIDDFFVRRDRVKFVEDLATSSNDIELEDPDTLSIGDSSSPKKTDDTDLLDLMGSDGLA